MRSTIVLLLIALGSTARADGGKRVVGIVDVRVEGVTPEAKAQFSSALEQKLAQSNYTLMTQGKMHEAMATSAKFTEGCVLGNCLMEVRAQTHAELVLLVAFNGSGTTYGYVVTLVRTDTGRVLSQHADRCDVCTVTEAMGKATTATLQLLDAVPAQLPDEAAERRNELAAIVAPYKTENATLKRHPRKVGIGIAIAGGAVAIIGAIVYAVSPSKAGVGVAAAGGGMLVGGIAILAF